MKITIVMGFFLPVPALAGGATEKIWHRLGEMMAAEGNDVVIISRGWPGLPDLETHGRLTHRRIRGMNHTRSLPVNLLLDLVWGLRVLFALPPADMVVCNTVTLPIYLRWLKPRAGKVAVVLGRMPKGQIRAYGAVHSLLATSTAVAEQARRENQRLGPRIFQFPNPMDWHLHAQAANRRQPNRKLTIGYVGRIHPEKGLEQLLEAAVRLAARPELPLWQLRLIGPVTVAQGGGGEAYRDRLLAQYAPTLGDRLAILPPIYDAAVLARHYGEFDIFCYPSLAAKGEGLSIAPIEAMAAGAVPVVSQLECYHDLIVPNQNGYQFDQTQPEAVAKLTDVLGRLLSDRPLRLQCAAQAQETARRFDYQETARCLLTEFQRLTQSRPAPN